MKFTKYLLLFSLFLLLSANRCTKAGTEVKIRVHNNSKHDFTALVLRGVTLGDLPQGQFSEYTTFPFAYSYDRVSFNIDTARFEMIPIDFVGAKKLKAGVYHYQLGIASFEDRMIDIKLVKE